MQARTVILIASLLVATFLSSAGTSQADDRSDLPPSLSDTQWNQLDTAVDRGLEFLATQQDRDGSFRSTDYAQPAVTSLCVMAFLSRGHLPGEGPYGEQLLQAVRFVVGNQQPDGLLFAHAGEVENWQVGGPYNHAISTLMMTEVYGMTDSALQKRLHKAIQGALSFSRSRQHTGTGSAAERGGWRYLIPGTDNISDLSVTSWYLMAYRSARNAGFDVAENDIDEAVSFVERCYDHRRGTFFYGRRGYRRTSFSRSMAGAGILSLSLAGKHNSEMALQTAQFVLRHPLTDFNRGALTREDRFYYAAYYCSQAMYQLGGEMWEEFYPPMLSTFVEHQRTNGSWDREAVEDQRLGFAYSTSFAILALTPPYQLLPVYQR